MPFIKLPIKISEISEKKNTGIWKILGDRKKIKYYRVKITGVSSVGVLRYCLEQILKHFLEEFFEIQSIPVVIFGKITRRKMEKSLEDLPLIHCEEHS